MEIPVSSLMDQKQHEQWYPLVNASAKSYIAGEVHLRLEHKPKEGVLAIQVVNARNLAPKGANGLSNPYIQLVVGKKKKLTKTIDKTRDPTYNEVFEFKSEPNATELVLSIWHADSILASEFMGQVTIPYFELEANMLYDAWYMVTDRECAENEDEEDDSDKKKDDGKTFLGDLRMVFKYTVRLSPLPLLD
jgi:hypothetical protein